MSSKKLLLIEKHNGAHGLIRKDTNYSCYHFSQEFSTFWAKQARYVLVPFQAPLEFCENSCKLTENLLVTVLTPSSGPKSPSPPILNTTTTTVEPLKCDHLFRFNEVRTTSIQNTKYFPTTSPMVVGKPCKRLRPRFGSHSLFFHVFDLSLGTKLRGLLLTTWHCFINESNDFFQIVDVSVRS